MLKENIWYIVGIALLFLLALIIFLVIRRVRQQEPVLDGKDFEDYCARLLVYRGFEKVEKTPASGDFGVDIFAMKDGVSWAFQCKYYNKPVGTRAVQEIYSGRDYYRCMIGVVMTNHGFTKNAVKLAEAHNILLWDGKVLDEMLE